MMIFLGIIGELATVIGTLVITTNAGIDAVLEIPKNGYKIDKDTSRSLLCNAFHHKIKISGIIAVL